MFEFLVNRKTNLYSQFIEDIQGSKMVLERVTSGGKLYNYAVVLTKHFPLQIWFYIDNDAGNEWPSKPAYANPEAGDTVVFNFTRYTAGAGIFREVELKDFDYVINDTDAVNFPNFISYIELVYYDPKKRQYSGFTPAFQPIPWLHPTKCGFSAIAITDGGTSSVYDLFQIWYQIKLRFEGNVMEQKEIDALFVPEYIAPEGPALINNHNIQTFQVVDRRNERLLTYSNLGAITGVDASKRIIVGTPPLIHMFYDVTVVNIDQIEYVAEVSLMAPILAKNTTVEGKFVNLMGTFANWLAYKVQLDIPLAETQEWWSGQFPKTPYNHMVFYGGHSFYIPDGFTVEANLTRLTKGAGYLTIKFIADIILASPVAIPMRYTVAYGKWSEYDPPNKDALIDILKRQWWSIWHLFSKNYQWVVIETKDAAIEMGKNGTIGVAAIPGLSFIASSQIGGK